MRLREVKKGSEMMPLSHRIYLIASGFLSVAEGFITIITLAYIHPFWTFKFFIWKTKREMKRKIMEDSCK